MKCYKIQSTARRPLPWQTIACLLASGIVAGMAAAGLALFVL